MNLDELYQTIVLDHYREKHHSGLREPYEAEVYHANPSYGDELTLRVRLDDDMIANMPCDDEGCSISQAFTSVPGSLMIGRDADHFSRLYDDFLEMMYSKGEITPDEGRFEDAVVFAGVLKFPARAKYALPAWSTLRDTVAQASAKEN